jgi:hypothetical protein
MMFAWGTDNHYRSGGYKDFRAYTKMSGLSGSCRVDTRQAQAPENREFEKGCRVVRWILVYGK